MSPGACYCNPDEERACVPCLQRLALFQRRVDRVLFLLGLGALVVLGVALSLAVPTPNSRSNSSEATGTLQIRPDPEPEPLGREER